MHVFALSTQGNATYCSLQELHSRAIKNQNKSKQKKKSCAFDMTVHSILDISVEAWTQLNVLEQNLMLTSKEEIFKKGKD